MMVMVATILAICFCTGITVSAESISGEIKNDNGKEIFKTISKLPAGSL